MMKSALMAVGLALLAAPALAHVSLEETEAVAGTTMKVTLRVPHGCKGEATHTVRLTLPDGFYVAKPMPKPGWTLTTEIGPYAMPYDTHGTAMTEGLRTVTWSQGNLPDEWYDEFTVRGTVGKDIAAGTVLNFPALQLCARGQADWTDTSGSHDVPNPAPALIVTAAQADAHHGHSMEDMAPITLGDLAISAAFSRATLPGAPVGGGFLTIANTGTMDDRLVSVTSPDAARTEIHEMAMDGQVMKMRPLPDGLPIPAGATVELRPGGYHLMLMDLNSPLVEGETVTVTLTFEKAGSVDVPLMIGAPNAKGHASH